MDKYQKIRRKIKEIAGVEGKNRLLFTAKVVSVEGRTCTVSIGNDMQLSDVRLHAVANADAGKILITPSVGSYVLVGDLSNGDLRELAALEYSKVDSVEIQIDGQTMKMDKDGVVFNGGTNSGMVKVEKLVASLNGLETKMGSLYEIFNKWKPFSGDGGAALQTLLLAWSGSTTLTNKTDLENDKIKH